MNSSVRWLLPALFSLVLSLAGCASVVSLHPLVVPNGKDTVFDPALLGTWADVKTGPSAAKTTYTVTRAESGYAVTATGDTKLEGTMHLMKAGKWSLLDVYCPSDGPQPPVHLFLRLRMEGDKAWVSELGSDWLKDQIAATGQPRHEALEGDEQLVLTASTAELRRHLLPYAADDRAFEEEVELARVK